MASRFIFDQKTGKLKLKTNAKRAYGAVVSEQLQEGWTTSLTNAHSEFRGGIVRLRNMTRDLERSNPYAIRFLNEWVTNIVGTGYTFQSLAVNAQGREDDSARMQIEDAWNDWKKARNCTASGDMPYNEFKALSERACARDGGVLIQKLKGFDNKYGFALNVLEIDRLDVNYNERKLANGNQVIMGKEIDGYGWNKPIAYHILGDHPGETYTRAGRTRTRIPADQIIHRFYRKRLESAHGEPLMVGAISGLRHLEKFEEAEQIAARLSACATVAIERDSSMPYEGEEFLDQELTPGGKFELEPGEKATLLSPTHPNSNYEGFRRGVLQGVASGLLTNYPNLGQDYGGVSYSSLRESKLNIKALTNVYRQMNVENEEEPIFRAWLGYVIRTGVIKLPASNFENFSKGNFVGKGYEWVDPLKDVTGLEKELSIGATSLSRAVKERLGVSLDTIIKERQRDIEAFKKAGLAVPPVLQQPIEPTDLLNQEEEDNIS
jgi:lambda family phage portal protein